MGILKEMAILGAYYIETGMSDSGQWSDIMIDEFGPNVRPFLHQVRQWSLIIAQRKAGPRTMKKNCWDFKKCGREAHGTYVKERGICPVYLCSELDGIHGGSRGGRACWAVNDALCGGKIRRMFVPRSVSCILCDFHRGILNEERSDLIISDRFLAMLVHGTMK